MNRILSLCMYCCVISVISTMIAKMCNSEDDQCPKTVVSIAGTFNCIVCIYFLFIYKEHVIR